MKGTAADAAAARAADDDGHAGAVAITAGRGEVREHVEAAGDEVDELQLRDRTHAHVSGAYRGSDDRGLGDGRVDDAALAEAVEQTVGDFERAAVLPDVLADQDDALIARHLLE